MAIFEINDAIHKNIQLTEREKSIVDHPYVQRLRFIRQLGFVPLVFPSATHDRFSHSLGTLYVATSLAKQLFYNESYSALAPILNEKEKRFLTHIVRLSGLLHDIGHAPFSHLSEAVMPPVRELNLPREWLLNPDEDRIATHEDFSVLLIAGMTEGKNAVLTREEAEIISSFIHHKKIAVPSYWSKFFSDKINSQSLHILVRSIVSSNIDADRMDYLLRDSYFTGVSYGHFDLKWLVSNLGVVEHDGEYLMSISDSGIHALEHYLFARYHMYVQVYMHKTVKCFEYYFQRALENKETAYDIPSERDAYVNLRDATIIEDLFQVTKYNPKSWSGRLIRREPSKRIARLWSDRSAAEKLLRGLTRDLKPYGIKPFLHISQSKFLDLPNPREQALAGKQGLFLFGLAAMPMVIIRKHLGVVSMASIADYSFILKHFHYDISIADIYILPDQYKSNAASVHKVITKYRTLSPSEIILREEM